MTISEYRWFNYSLNFTGFSLFDNWQKPDVDNQSYEINEAVNQFNSLFDKLCRNRLQKKHLVPISGGFDSRAILAALLDRVPADNIETISFGFPGQLDYEIGAMVSNTLGVKHHQFNLLDILIDWNDLVETARRSPTTFHFDALFNYLSRTLFTNDVYTIWSGFMGDPLAGSHLSNNESVTLEGTLQTFTTKQKKVEDVDEDRPNTLAFQQAMQSILTKSLLRPEDLVNFTLRQANCIAPIVLPIKSWSSWGAEVGNETTGAEVVAPFIDKAWAEYWLYAPLKSRLNQQLYMGMLNRIFPDVMKLPSKDSLGLSPKSKLRVYFKSKMVGAKKRLNLRFPCLSLTRDIRANYLDYAAIFRQRNDYKKVIEQAFEILAQNHILPESEAKKLWREHMNKESNHAEYFCLLIGLAANVEAKML